jgi:pimeloyl-ACP methyl ester carboxylesterase
LPGQQSGFLAVPLSWEDPKNPAKVQLYWEKFPARRSPARGAVFFLAGGPLPHWFYHGAESPHFLKGIFDDYDFYMFDYRGMNCSSRVQSMATLRSQLRQAPEAYSLPTFARDVRSLRDRLVGKGQKIILFGGSYGFFLGVQVLIDHPEIVESAILFHGDTDAAFWHQGMLRLDSLITGSLAARNPKLVSGLETLKKKLDAGELVLFAGTPKERRLTWADFQVQLWMNFGQSVAAQEKLPRIVELILKGDETAAKILEGFHKISEGLAQSLLVGDEKEPPTASSLVSGYARCNVLFDKGARAELTKRPTKGRFLGTEALVAYFDRACKNLDRLPTRRYDLTHRLRPVPSPVLVIHTGRDMFDPGRVAAHLARLGPAAKLVYEPEWAHDFGQDMAAGVQRFTKLLREFLGLDTTPRPVHPPQQR